MALTNTKTIILFPFFGIVRTQLLCTYVGSIPENIRYMYIRVNNNAAYGDADNNSKGKGQKVKEK